MSALKDRMKRWRPEPPPLLEENLHEIIQSFLIHSSTGMTVEQSLHAAIGDTEWIPDAFMKSADSTYQALNRYCTALNRKEVWRFVRLINQMHRTGSTATLPALEKYHDELWSVRLARIRKRSEIIALQMTFLLMLSLISVIVVVIAPVMLMFY